MHQNAQLEKIILENLLQKSTWGTIFAKEAHVIFVPKMAYKL